MGNENRSMYEDMVYGTILDNQHWGMFIFARLGLGADRRARVLAQSLEGRVFWILTAGYKGNEILISMQDAAGQNHTFSFTKVVELEEGTVFKSLGRATDRTRDLGSWFGAPREWWKPIDQRKIEECALGFGYMLHDCKLSKILESFLKPKTTEYVYCDFALNNGPLALVVRTIHTEPCQEFVLAVDEHAKVFLVKRCEVVGLFSQRLILEVRGQDGCSRTLQVPLTALPQEQTGTFSQFLGLECVRNLTKQNFDSLPEGIFEPSPRFLRVAC